MNLPIDQNFKPGLGGLSTTTLKIAPVSTMPVGISTNALVVALVDASGNQITNFISTNSSVSSTSQTIPSTATMIAGSDYILPVSELHAVKVGVRGNVFSSLTDSTGQNNVTVTAFTNSNAVSTVLVDSAGNQLGTAANPIPVTIDSAISIGSVEITDGTNIANVLKSDGTAAGQNAQLVAGTYKEVTFTTTTAQAVATTDAINYKWVSVHVTSQGTSSSVSFQGSNDNTNWVTVALQNINTTTSSLSGNTLAANVIFHGALNFRYFRLNVTGISAGTTAGVVEFYTLPNATMGIGASAAQAGTWTVGSNSATGSAVPANAFYIGYAQGGNLQAMTGTTTTDGISNSVSGPIIRSYTYLYNGSTYDSFRNNQDVTLLASAARTTTQTSADIINYNGISALVVTLDMTTVGTGSVTLSINGKDTASGKYYTILTGSAVTTNSTNVYRVGPKIAAVANSIAQDYLPRTFQIVVTANNANSATYSVGYSLLRG